MNLSDKIINEALKLGFNFAAIAGTDELPHSKHLDKWLADGHHSTMSYLERNVEKRKKPSLLMENTRSILVAGFNYKQTGPDEAVSNDSSRGLVSRYAWGLDYHDLLRSKLNELAERIKELSDCELNYRAFVDSAPILERSLAFSANLGFIGKNTLLIRPGIGSYFFLGELLLDIDLPSAKRQADQNCGSCDLCQKNCPTNALATPYILAAERCINYLTIENKGPIPIEFRKKIGNKIYGCDICQDVCPYNKTTDCYSSDEFFRLRSEDYASPDLLFMMALSQEEFSRMYKGSAIKRIKRKGLLRNVAVAIGNWGDPSAISVLEKVMYDSEPLIRGHVAWALGQNENRKEADRILSQARTDEKDPYVIDEINGALNELEKTDQVLLD